ncbi:MAG: hypothetical protein M1840_007607 [Geoglossum simile]|nr:MAG: hypothetical protein M1840_007607 [Geoglossum simile]
MTTPPSLSRAEDNMDREKLENATRYMREVTVLFEEMIKDIEPRILGLQKPLGKPAECLSRYTDIVGDYRNAIDEYHVVLRQKISQYVTFEDTYPFEKYRLRRLVLSTRRLKEKLGDGLYEIKCEMEGAFVARMPGMKRNKYGCYLPAPNRWTEEALTAQRGFKCSKEHSFWSNDAFQAFSETCPLATWETYEQLLGHIGRQIQMDMNEVPFEGGWITHMAQELEYMQKR